MLLDLTCSIVIYNTEIACLETTVQSLLHSPLKIKLFVIDNSPVPTTYTFLNHPGIEYIFNHANLGYGKGHNIAITRSIEMNAPFHLVLNPDVIFDPSVLSEIYNYMLSHKEVGLVMPKVLYLDNQIQRLCKLLPTPLNLFSRRFMVGKWKEKWNRRYELHDFNYDKIINTPCLSGCFMFMSADALKASKGFDERFFMYLEDYDLTRRIHKQYKTLFYPYGTIYHGYQRHSYKNGRLMLIHLISAFKYFNKWGWFIDKERSLLNKNVLDQLRGQRL